MVAVVVVLGTHLFFSLLPLSFMLLLFFYTLSNKPNNLPTKHPNPKHPKQKHPNQIHPNPKTLSLPQHKYRRSPLTSCLQTVLSSTQIVVVVHVTDHCDQKVNVYSPLLKWRYFLWFTASTPNIPTSNIQHLIFNI